MANKVKTGFGTCVMAGCGQEAVSKKAMVEHFRTKHDFRDFTAAAMVNAYYMGRS